VSAHGAAKTGVLREFIKESCRTANQARVLTSTDGPIPRCCMPKYKCKRATTPYTVLVSDPAQTAHHACAHHCDRARCSAKADHMGTMTVPALRCKHGAAGRHRPLRARQQRHRQCLSATCATHVLAGPNVLAGPGSPYCPTGRQIHVPKS